MDKTKEQMDQEYQDELTVLIENKKLGLLAQDQFDAQQAALSKRIYGKKPDKKEK